MKKLLYRLFGVIWVAKPGIGRKPIPAVPRQTLYRVGVELVTPNEFARIMKGVKEWRIAA